MALGPGFDVCSQKKKLLALFIIWKIRWRRTFSLNFCRPYQLRRWPMNFWRGSCYATYLSCSLSTWKVRSITVVICKPRIMNVKGLGLSTAMIWQSLTVKLLRGSPMARALSGLFLKPTREPSSSRRKYRALQFFICSPAKQIDRANCRHRDKQNIPLLKSHPSLTTFGTLVDCTGCNGASLMSNRH